MEPSDFKKWRKSMGFSQKDAAHVLGLKRRMIQYYEKGERDGDKVKIPRTVRLACYSLTQQVSDYHGPGKKIVALKIENLAIEQAEEEAAEAAEAAETAA